MRRLIAMGKATRGRPKREAWPQQAQAWPERAQAWPERAQAWLEPARAWPEPAQAWAQAWPEPDQAWPELHQMWREGRDRPAQGSHPTQRPHPLALFKTFWWGVLVKSYEYRI